MSSLTSNARRRCRTTFLCAVAVIFFKTLSEAETPSRRDAFVTPYQPFALFTADTGNGKRIVRTTRLGTAASKAIRVAYFVAQPPAVTVPRAEPVQDYDQEQQWDDEEEIGPAYERREWRPIVAGSRAVLRNGIAYAPAHAPDSVKAAIWAANSLRHKPYAWGGGHASFDDDGYDCSGSVSFALHGGGLLATPLPSTDLMGYGQRGRGRWITIYSRPGHTFAVIAGLRLDTTDFRYGDVGPRWHTDGRDTRGFVARHPAGT